MVSVDNKIKDMELNFVLEKLKQKKELTKAELDFLCNFDNVSALDHTDSSHLSKNQVFEKITYYLSKDKKIICDIKDKNGKINDFIISITNDFEKDYCSLNMKHGDYCKIYDNFFYKITYDFTKDTYTLEEQDQFYEKIMIEKDEN